MPKNTNVEVSVIIPTYNRAELLKRSIQSVLNQTYQNFELIIVDDCSDDNTREIVKSFKDPKIRYYKHSKNKGPAAARNKGIKHAKGKYIAFQDSDDEWLPEKLEIQIDCFKNSEKEIGVVYCRAIKKNGKKTDNFPSPKISKADGYIYPYICRGNFILMPSAVIKKECLTDTGGFDELFTHMEDWELLIRISKKYNIRFIDVPLVKIHYTPGGVNEQGLLIEAITTEKILNKHYNEFKNDKKLIAHYEYLIGNLQSQLKDKITQGRAYLRLALKHDPYNIKYAFSYIVSLIGNSAYVRFASLKHLILKCL